MTTRTATIVKADGILCKGGADPNGTPVDVVLRASPLKLSAKGKYSGAFTGTTENNVPVMGTLHGTVSKKLATIRGTITGTRNDPNEPPPLACKSAVSDDALQVWLGKKEVLKKPLQRKAAPDQDKVTLALEPGAHGFRDGFLVVDHQHRL